MSPLYYIKHVIAQNGFNVIEIGNHIYVLPRGSNSKPVSELMKEMVEVIKNYGGIPLREPETVHEVWIDIEVEVKGQVTLFSIWNYVDYVQNRPQGISWPTVMMFLLYILGIVVSPGWWKLGAVLGVPAFYFAIEFLLNKANVL